MKFKTFPIEKLNINTHKLSYIILEKEINNKINYILNLIIFDTNKKSNCIYRNEYIDYINNNLYKLEDKSHIFRDSINNLHIKWRYYNKISINVLKEYVKLFYRKKKNSNFFSINEELINIEKKECHKQNKDKNDVKLINEVINENEKLNNVNRITHKNIVYKNILSRKSIESKNKRETENSCINSSNDYYVNFYKDININDIKYIWLKHLLVIFKLLIECNLKVDDKRKLDITRVITNFLKNNNININTDLYFSYTYLLSKINMIDKELVILMCNNVKDDYKFLSSLNKYYLFSCIHNFDFSSKKFQQIINYLNHYFYELIKEEYINIKRYSYFNEKNETSNKDSLEEKKKDSCLNNNQIFKEMPVNCINKLIAPSISKNKSEEFIIINNYLFDIYENLYKRKKYISYVDKIIFQYIINEELLKYNKIHLKIFRSILKICNKDMLHYLFKKIIENIESYDTSEIYNMFRYFIKSKSEFFQDFLLILKDKNFENMNIKYLIYLYISINRILAKDFKKNKKKKNSFSIQNYYIEEFSSINYDEYDKLINEINIEKKKEETTDSLDANNLIRKCEDFFNNESEMENNNLKVISECLDIINSINEEMITVLIKKINYLNSNNIITILYNTCSIFFEKQIIFVNKLFSQLYEENYIIINFLHIYNKLFYNFVFYYNKQDNNIKLMNLMDNIKENMKLISVYEKKTEIGFNYIKKRYYINEHILNDISKYTIILNIYDKFFLDTFMYYIYLNSEKSEVYKKKLILLIIHIYTHFQFIFFNSSNRILPINILELIFNYSQRIIKNINIYINAIICALRFTEKRKIFKSNKNENKSNMKDSNFCKHHVLNSSSYDINLLLYNLFNENEFNINSLNINENNDSNILHINVNNNFDNTLSANVDENINNNFDKKFSSIMNYNLQDNINNTISNIRNFLFIAQYINYICSYIYIRTNSSESLSIKENLIYICLSLLKYNKENTFVINNIFKILKGMNSDDMCKNIIFIIALDYIHKYCNIKGILIKLFRFLKKDDIRKISSFNIPSNNTNLKILTRYLKHLEKR
ncbi:conserved Plasmodium protein, unknown function [Plasmodium gallinaceum]|uniref:Uncharacterized protein n=1 Tax=Plasmodium gallinaceum TaxID=5849 RepID=A0A1J1GUE8_PLAGA|nr:conserved Plasmodium protein, unknown function [Plasmodium gallinaceum]CRG95867.1 conserved Plasmodium protein, unknown function [Plasmodium gallinaceum]